MKRLLLTILKLLISVAILAWLVHQARTEEAFARLWNEPKDWSLLLVAWAICLATVLIGIVRWHLLVVALELPFRMRDALRLGLLAYLLNFVSLGSVGGDLFKALFIAREQPGRRTEAVATVVVDRVIGLYSLFLLAGCTIVAMGLVSSEVRELRILSYATLALTAAGTVVGGVLLGTKFTRGSSFQRLCRLRWFGGVLQRLGGALNAYRGQSGTLAMTVAMSLVIHVTMAFAIYLIAVALPGSAPALVHHFVIVPISFVAAATPLPLSGLGAFEAALEFLYRHCSGSVSITAGQGLLVALAFRLVTIAIAAVAAVVYLINRGPEFEVERVEDVEPAISG